MRWLAIVGLMLATMVSAQDVQPPPIGEVLTYGTPDPHRFDFLAVAVLRVNDCCADRGASIAPCVNRQEPVYLPGDAVSPPRAVYAPEPEYSEEASKKKKNGKMSLAIVVSSTGAVCDIRVRQSAGFGLDEKAIEAVRQWKFEPALKDGKPVAVEIKVSVEFRLT